MCDLHNFQVNIQSRLDTHMCNGWKGELVLIFLRFQASIWMQKALYNLAIQTTRLLDYCASVPCGILRNQKKNYCASTSHGTKQAPITQPTHWPLAVGAAAVNRRW
eukprot:TRINITY_DN67047_c5_g1_i1.p1 TRINITY_DN67047_c5_g1~~TRINITY_DN67047_c5_g1_i1.p1  ORF type:complete len:106 (+),score=6.22 TRINITY_DN67047_c5_g1_i1:275-592(+)